MKADANHDRSKSRRVSLFVKGGGQLVCLTRKLLGRHLDAPWGIVKSSGIETAGAQGVPVVPDYII